MTDYNDLITRLRSMDGQGDIQFNELINRRTGPEAADAIAELVARLAYLESRLEVTPEHDIDGIAARDATIHHQDECISELKFRLAESEDTNKALRVRLGSEPHEPVTTVEDRYNADGKSCHITDDLPAGMPLYAASPVAAPVRLTDSDVVDLFQAWNTTDGASHADLILSVETAVLRANGFKLEGEQ